MARRCASLLAASPPDSHLAEEAAATVVAPSARVPNRAANHGSCGERRSSGPGDISSGGSTKRAAWSCRVGHGGGDAGVALPGGRAEAAGGGVGVGGTHADGVNGGSSSLS